MRLVNTIVFGVVLVAGAQVVPAKAAEQDANGWETASPESVGLDSASLAEKFRFIQERNIPVLSMQIVRRDRLVLDAYFYPFNATLRHDVASVTKSITSTLVGRAIDLGLLRDVHESVEKVFPAQRNDSRNKRGRCNDGALAHDASRMIALRCE